jgi:hypothetical protein
MKRHDLTRQQEHFLGVISGATLPMAFDTVDEMSERRKGFLDGVNYAMQLIAASGPVPQGSRDEDRYSKHLTACAIRCGMGCTCHDIMRGAESDRRAG